MTSRTTSWSSTTSTVPMCPASTLTVCRGIPVPGCRAPRAPTHTAFLLVSRRDRRPVRGDVRIAELAVGHARPGEQLAVGREELVDACVLGHGPLPGAAH